MTQPVELQPPACALCGPEHVVVETYRPPKVARRVVPIGRGKVISRTSSEPGFAFFRCTRCGLQDGGSVPNSYRPPGWSDDNR